MPNASRYWKNPQKHRDECNNRRRRLYALGLTFRNQLSPLAATKHRAATLQWRRQHKYANKLASRKYRAKLQRMFGSASRSTQWQHHMYKEEQDARKRKALAASS